VNEPTPPPQSIEDKLTSIRERLEDSFAQFHAILDVCIACHKAFDMRLTG